MRKQILIYVIPVVLGIVAVYFTFKSEREPLKKTPDKPAAVETETGETEVQPPVVEAGLPPETGKTEDGPVGNTSSEEVLEIPGVPEEGREETPSMSVQEARDILAGQGEALSADVMWMSFIGREDAIQRFVKAVDVVAAGERPLAALDCLELKGMFSAEKNAEGRMVVSHESMQRFQKLVDAVCSVDLQKAGKLYLALEPTLEQVFHMLGYPESETFRTRLRAACTVLLETPKIDYEPELVHIAGFLYKYANPQLEELLPVQKFMIRLGKENRERVRSQVIGFANELKLYRETEGEQHD